MDRIPVLLLVNNLFWISSCSSNFPCARNLEISFWGMEDLITSLFYPHICLFFRVYSSILEIIFLQNFEGNALLPFTFRGSWEVQSYSDPLNPLMPWTFALRLLLEISPIAALSAFLCWDQKPKNLHFSTTLTTVIWFQFHQSRGFVPDPEGRKEAEA